MVECCVVVYGSGWYGMKSWGIGCDVIILCVVFVMFLFVVCLFDVCVNWM